MKKLVIASNNPGKLREFQFLLQPLGIEVLTQGELGIAEAEEPHNTFIENAGFLRKNQSPALKIPTSSTTYRAVEKKVLEYSRL